MKRLERVVQELQELEHYFTTNAETYNALQVVECLRKLETIQTKSELEVMWILKTPTKNIHIRNKSFLFSNFTDLKQQIIIFSNNTYIQEYDCYLSDCLTLLYCEKQNNLIDFANAKEEDF